MSLVGTLAKVAVGAMVAKGVGGMLKGGGAGGSGGGLGGLLGSALGGRQGQQGGCLLYTSPSPRDGLLSRMPSSA